MSRRTYMSRHNGKQQLTLPHPPPSPRSKATLLPANARLSLSSQNLRTYPISTIYTETSAPCKQLPRSKLSNRLCFKYHNTHSTTRSLEQAAEQESTPLGRLRLAPSLLSPVRAEGVFCFYFFPQPQPQLLELHVHKLPPPHLQFLLSFPTEKDIQTPNRDGRGENNVWLVQASRAHAGEKERDMFSWLAHGLTRPSAKSFYDRRHSRRQETCRFFVFFGGGAINPA